MTVAQKSRSSRRCVDAPAPVSWWLAAGGRNATDDLLTDHRRSTATSSGTTSSEQMIELQAGQVRLCTGLGLPCQFLSDFTHCAFAMCMQVLHFSGMAQLIVRHGAAWVAG